MDSTIFASVVHSENRIDFDKAAGDLFNDVSFVLGHIILDEHFDVI